MSARRATVVDELSGQQPVGFWDIKYGQCKWPLTEVVPLSEFRFCGRQCVAGLSWCPEHALVATSGA
jgi:hypothetical protein